VVLTRTTPPPRSLSVAAFVIAAAFGVHAVNGLVVERLVLGFTSFADYADAELLADAIGSWPWRASGLAHLATAAAMVAVAVLSRPWLDHGSATRASAAHAFALLSATGFALNGIAAGLGAQVVGLLEEQNPASASSAVIAFSVLVPVVNGLAIVAMACVVATISLHLRSEGALGPAASTGTAVVVLSGLVMAVAYVPAYLLLLPVWWIWFGVRVRRTAAFVLR
jgi:hypothetical protein